MMKPAPQTVWMYMDKESKRLLIAVYGSSQKELENKAVCAYGRFYFAGAVAVEVELVVKTVERSSDG
jgi:hypothetical protein